MVNCTSVKLELSQTNPTQFFDINSETHCEKIHCVAKASGKQGVNYFSSKFRFVVNYKKNIGRISDIHINDVTHIGKTDIPFRKCGKFHYYYDINSSDSSSSSSSSSVIDDQFELAVYEAIKTMLINATVAKVGFFIRVTLTLPNSFDSMCIKIKIGSNKYSQLSSSNDCNDCSLSAVKKSHCSSSKSGGCCSSSSSSSSKSCKSSSSSSSSSSWSSSSSSSSSRCNSFMQKIIKLIAWSAVISFIVYVLKKKICVCINTTQNVQPVIEYKNETVQVEIKENIVVEDSDLI